jgi:GH43 family beta-xylosidase
MCAPGWAALALGCSSPSSPPEQATTDAGGSRDAESLDARDGSAVDGSARDSQDGVVDARDSQDAGVDAALGLRASYFRRHGPLTLERVDPTVDFAWGNDGPAASVGVDHFSARWEGTLDVPAAGDYTFVVTADDGVRLWIGDVLILDQWAFQDLTRYEATATLAQGQVALRLEYFDYLLASEVHLAWRSAASPETIIPEARLHPAPAGSGEASPKPPYQNPVVPMSCPDPGVLAISGTTPDYYMVCTGGSFPIRHSAELIFWDDTGTKVFPAGKPPWALNSARDWAPEIHQVGTRYVTYYTANDASGRLAIGATSATAPLGPYTDVGAPLVQDPLGVIDATYFADDDGRQYLFYKIDGNSQGQPTPIFARELAPDGLSFAAGSTPTQVLVNDPTTWEGGVIEGPWVVKRQLMYFIFYSGNVYDSRYRTGVARSASLYGPYEKHGAPILANNVRWVGPGHGSVVPLGASDYFIYHAWSATPQGTNDTTLGRQVLLDRIVWQNGWPSISDGTPSHDLEPWPSQ